MGRLSIAALRVLLVLILLGGVLAQLWFFPRLAEELVLANPGLAWLHWPMLIAVWLIILAAEIGLVAVWVLLGMVEGDRVFTAGAFRWVDVIIVMAIAATVLVAGVFALSWLARANPPALMLTELALVLGGTAFALLMTVMKRLLRQASQLSAELSEVI